MASTENSLVMGVASRYTPEVIAPFLKSLRNTNYRGRVCLLVGDMSEANQGQLRLWADEIINLDGVYSYYIDKYHLKSQMAFLAKMRNARRIRRLYPFLFKLTLRIAKSTERKDLQRDMEKSLEGFQSLRYGHYLDYILQSAKTADYVMISDVRDVIFQRDPFDHEFKAELKTFLESPSITIGSDSFNRRWIENLYGKAVLKDIKESTVCCSGTTMGTREGMTRYFKKPNV